MSRPNYEQPSKESSYIHACIYAGLTCIAFLVSLLIYPYYLVLFFLPWISIPLMIRVPNFIWTASFQYVFTVLFLILFCLKCSGFSDNNSLMPMLIVGTIMLALGTCGLSIVILYKGCTKGNDLGIVSAKAESVSLRFLIVCSVNGYSMVCVWCLYHDTGNESLQNLGYVGYSVLLILYCLSIIFVIVDDCKELEKKRAVVNAINQDPELSQVVANAINQNPRVVINVQF